MLYLSLIFCMSIHPLHSNLVIFKLYPDELKHYILRHFTFQSGYIQITSLKADTAFLLPFTFQSGYIQIKQQRFADEYIISFTFQSGYIQIMEKLEQVEATLTFTFQSGYIQICPNCVILFNVPNVFTFQSGYIQIAPFQPGM